MFIVGAGLSGLIAASLMPDATIVESGPQHQLNHKALLRFRNRAVGDALGIEFRRVTVRKAIYFDGKFVEPTMQLANFYSQKVLGRIADRSIWSLDTAERFIAPEDLIQILTKRLASRILWRTPFSPEEHKLRERPVVSTAPMPINLNICGIAHDKETFKYAPITVRRWRIRDCDVHQTVYFPDPTNPLYRASITGDLMIAEYAGSPQFGAKDARFLEEVFGLHYAMQPLDTNEQRFGKIASIESNMRKRAIRHMTEKYKLYSLGRFATWRNILLDDVLNDVYVIKKLLTSDGYDAARIGV